MVPNSSIKNVGPPGEPASGPALGPKLPLPQGGSLDTQTRASWIFGSLFVVFLLGVFLFGPAELPEYKQRILAYVCALLAGVFALFFTGSLLLHAELPMAGRWAVQGGAGSALFLIVLFWWFGPAAPVRSAPTGSAGTDGTKPQTRMTPSAGASPRAPKEPSSVNPKNSAQAQPREEGQVSQTSQSASPDATAHPRRLPIPTATPSGKGNGVGRENINNLDANWPAMNDYQEPPRPIELLSANCKMIVAYDNGGKVTPTRPMSESTGTDFKLLWITPNSDGTISFEASRMPSWKLAVERDVVKMQFVSKEQENQLEAKFKFRFRPIGRANGNPSYADNCRDIAITTTQNWQAAGLLEPLSAPGHVLRWRDSSFQISPSPPPSISAPQDFEREAVFLVGFPKPSN